MHALLGPEQEEPGDGARRRRPPRHRRLREGAALPRLDPARCRHRGRGAGHAQGQASSCPAVPPSSPGPDRCCCPSPTGLAAAGVEVAALVESADPRAFVRRTRALAAQPGKVAEGRRVRGPAAAAPGARPRPAHRRRGARRRAAGGGDRRRARRRRARQARYRTAHPLRHPRRRPRHAPAHRSRRGARLPPRRPERARRRRAAHRRTRRVGGGRDHRHRRRRPLARRGPHRRTVRRRTPRRAATPDPRAWARGREVPYATAGVLRRARRRVRAARALDRAGHRRHRRVPLRGGHRRRDPGGRARSSGPATAHREAADPGRHGLVPGPDVRARCRRARRMRTHPVPAAVRAPRTARRASPETEPTQHPIRWRDPHDPRPPPLARRPRRHRAPAERRPLRELRQVRRALRLARRERLRRRRTQRLARRVPGAHPRGARQGRRDGRRRDRRSAGHARRRRLRLRRVPPLGRAGPRRGLSRP